MSIAEDRESTSVSNQTRHPIWRLAGTVLAIALLVLLSVLGWAYSRTGSVALVPRFLNGEELLVDPMTISLGTLRSGGNETFGVRIVNATTRKVTLDGAQMSCSCITSEEFPISIGPGESRELKMNLHVGPPGEMEQSIKFYTDFAGQRAFVVNVRGFAEK